MTQRNQKVLRIAELHQETPKMPEVLSHGRVDPTISGGVTCHKLLPGSLAPLFQTSRAGIGAVCDHRASGQTYDGLRGRPVFGCIS